MMEQNEQLMETAQPIIEINHLGKTFGDHVVLKDIHFSIQKGETVSVIVLLPEPEEPMTLTVSPF